MTEIHPPFPPGLGNAPAGVCSRWLDGSPCGALAAHHVIWDTAMTNGALCGAHEAEARALWAWIGLHPYDHACASPGEAEWLPDEDRCVLPGDDGDQERAGAASGYMVKVA